MVAVTEMRTPYGFAFRHAPEWELPLLDHHERKTGAETTFARNACLFARMRREEEETLPAKRMELGLSRGATQAFFV